MRRPRWVRVKVNQYCIEELLVALLTRMSVVNEVR